MGCRAIRRRGQQGDRYRRRLPLRSDGAHTFLFLLALLGSPAVVVTLAGWLPRAWSSELPQALGLLPAVPVSAVELFLAVWLPGAEANAAGPAWIE